MTVTVLIVGKTLNIRPLETWLASMAAFKYICVDDLAAARWLLESRLSKVLMVVDRRVCADASDVRRRVGADAGLEVVAADTAEVESPAFMARLTRAANRLADQGWSSPVQPSWLNWPRPSAPPASPAFQERNSPRFA